MANWKYKLDFSSWWDDEDLSIQEKAQLAAKEINKVLPTAWLDYCSASFDADLDDIFFRFADFEEDETIEDFDSIMEDLYNWANQEIPDFGKWPSNKMCWVATT